MHPARTWKWILGVEDTVIETLHPEGDRLIVRVRPMARARRRCGRCGRRCSAYDRGDGRRRWRGLDLGTVRVYLEAESPRVRCVEHGVVVAAVPWARHGAGFTRAFDDMTAWLAKECAKTAIQALMRISWPTVGRIISRVMADAGPPSDRLKNLRRIGIDEVSYRKGQRYLTVVVDHDTGKLVWAAPGADKATLNRFFDLLGHDGCQTIELVSADAASWIREVVTDRCINAEMCMDAFHVVQWATQALDEVRRQYWRKARTWGQHWKAHDLRGARWALLKNPEDLTDRQRIVLAELQETNKDLFRAYLLKEQLRAVFQAPSDGATRLLDSWLVWARRCRLEPFVKVASTITQLRDQVVSALQHRLSNARVEATNTGIRLITRRAYGFHSPQALIALAMLRFGALCPDLPGRA